MSEHGFTFTSDNVFGLPYSSVKGKPSIVVSSKGLANGTSNIPNDGADFGPDTPGTQTSGLQEAANTGKPIRLKDLGFYIISEEIIPPPNSTFIIDFPTGLSNTYGNNVLTPDFGTTIVQTTAGKNIFHITSPIYAFIMNGGVNFYFTSDPSNYTPLSSTGNGIFFDADTYFLSNPDASGAEQIMCSNLYINGIITSYGIDMNHYLFRFQNTTNIQQLTGIFLAQTSPVLSWEAVFPSGATNLYSMSSLLICGQLTGVVSNALTRPMLNVSTSNASTLSSPSITRLEIFGQVTLAGNGGSASVPIINFDSTCVGFIINAIDSEDWPTSSSYITNNGTYIDIRWDGGIPSGINWTGKGLSVTLPATLNFWSPNGGDTEINSDTGIFINQSVQFNYPTYATAAMYFSKGFSSAGNRQNLTPSISANPPASGTVYQNTNGYDIILKIPVTYNPTSTAAATLATGVSASSTVTTTTKVSKPAGLTAADGEIDTYEMIVPDGFYFEIDVSNATIGTVEVEPR